MSRGHDPVRVQIQGAVQFEQTILDVAAVVEHQLKKSSINYEKEGPEGVYGSLDPNVVITLTLNTKQAPQEVEYDTKNWWGKQL